MVNTQSVQAGNPSQPFGQGQLPNNLPPQLPPLIPNMFPPVDHAEGGDENQPHNSASTANQDVVTTQLAAMQQQFGVFQLVLAQLLARNNPGDPLINLLNPAPQPRSTTLSSTSHITPAQQPLPDDVTRRLDSLEKLVAEQRGAPPPHHTADHIPHPLNTNITLEPYPVGFKIPQLETYDGTKDPDDHLHAFYSCILPPRSISSYTEMTSAFATKFSSRRLIRKTTSELMRVKQRYGESLKNYMSKFNDAVLEVSSFDQAVGIAAVISSLNHERFRDSLIKHPATTFNEPTPSKNQNPDWRDENQSRKRMRIAQNRGPMSTSTPRFGRLNSAPPQQSVVRFLVVKMPSSFNVVIGRPTLTEIRAMVSQSHLCMKFPTPMGIATLRVPIALEDKEKTSFYAGDEIYCYVMMPFGLKNAGATYQKMVTIVFRAQIGQNLEVYVDDIVVKSLKAEDHLTNLDEIFNNLKKNRMRLNLAKCIFGVEFGKFLGFMVSRRGIEVNPEKIKAMAEMESPKSVKDANDGEILYLCLDISDEAISFVLVREEGKQQKPVYYISSVLHGAEIRYFIVEKAALAVVTSARKLRPYFQSHPIIVLTDQPLRQILQKPECSGRLIKWAVELGEFEITFQQRSAIRAQALADFIVECTSAHFDSQSKLDSWILYVDGASSNKSSGVGAILLGPDGYRSEHALKFNFDAINNMAEYEALLLGLQLPAEELTNLVAPWPFSQWGLDLLGPFMKGVGGITHLIVGVDYFTKWVEARLLSSLTSKKVEYFVFSSIICRYGILNQIVADNGTQFNCFSFRDFCSSYGIKLQFTSVYHLESNGMVESVNKVILEGIKPREEARLRTLVYKQKLANFYNKRVQPRTFKVGDLVLKKAGLTGFETRFGKLTPNWEGPYTVAEVPHLGAYILRDTEGKRVPRVWNVNNLKKFYSQYTSFK
ncbi:hypothetical protein SLEP1_g23237 [Rubroshorea leprosula]|uniref:Integrase catalytic domain-containing protein n=1 Tax=Rubroshorea leprosula TaxID=152421 RepID=A0AAV5JHW4_9ROSI|nr:hypothetical protein SLEP1_g23237 [Rubroshorea leprosula]